MERLRCNCSGVKAEKVATGTQLQGVRRDATRRLAFLCQFAGKRPMLSRETTDSQSGRRTLDEFELIIPLPSDGNRHSAGRPYATEFDLYWPLPPLKE
jgi:hypothetical protein